MNMHRRWETVKTSLIRLVLILFSLVFLLPFIWALYSSLKTSREFLENPWNFPQGFYLQNYSNAFFEANMGRYAVNSAFTVLVAVTVCSVLSFTTAYTITRFSNIYTRILRQAYVSAFMLPAIFGLIPLFLMLNRIGLYDNLIGLALIDTTIILPFTVFVLTGFLSGISKEYEEAAFIDGCSRFGVMFRIIFPLAVPSLITVGIFNFMGIWNEYIYATTMIVSDAKKTLPIGLVNLMARQQHHTDWGALFAGMVIVMLPSILIYLLMQKKITSGAETGGIKM